MHCVKAAAEDGDLSEAAAVSTSEATETATADEDSAADRRKTATRPKALPTPARKPNVNVGSKIKAMLQETKESPVERRPRPQRVSASVTSGHQLTSFCERRHNVHAYSVVGRCCTNAFSVRETFAHAARLSAT